MISGGFGGGNTTTGLRFETRVDLDDVLMSIHGYQVMPIPLKAGKGVGNVEKIKKPKQVSSYQNSR